MQATEIMSIDEATRAIAALLDEITTIRGTAMNLAAKVPGGEDDGCSDPPTTPQGCLIKAADMLEDAEMVADGAVTLLMETSA